MEMYLVNPAVSPNVVVIAQKSRLSSAAAFPSAVGFPDFDDFSGSEIVAKPSYLLVKAGVYGEGGKQMNRFIPSVKLNYKKSTATFSTDGCLFSAENLAGSVDVREEDLRVHPEFSCNSGTMFWDLKYEVLTDSKKLYSDSRNFWIPLGSRANFAGSVVLDGEEFSVLPETSFGYIDKSWGAGYPGAYYHLSAMRLTSTITRKSLRSSYICVEGEFGKESRLSGIIRVGENSFRFGEGVFGSPEEKHGCVQVPGNGDGESLHWSVSLENGDFVVDLDLYCKDSEMFVRDYEIPQGRRTLMRVLGGGTGSGEVRVFKKNGKRLELLEQAVISDAICEFGQLDEMES